MQGENQHQNHPYYYYPSILPHPHLSMPQNPHENTTPHPYPSIPTHPIFLCQHFTSTPIHAPYVVPKYPHVTSVGYLHIPFSILSSSMFPDHSS